MGFALALPLGQGLGIYLAGNLLANKKGKLILTCNKQKDAEEFEDIELRTREVPSADTIVIVNEPRAAKLVERRSDMLSALREAAKPLSTEQWLSLMESTTGMPRATFFRYLVILRENDEIIKENGEYRPSAAD